MERGEPLKLAGDEFFTLSAFSEESRCLTKDAVGGHKKGYLLGA